MSEENTREKTDCKQINENQGLFRIALPTILLVTCISKCVYDYIIDIYGAQNVSLIMKDYGEAYLALMKIILIVTCGYSLISYFIWRHKGKISQDKGESIISERKLTKIDKVLAVQGILIVVLSVLCIPANKYFYSSCGYSFLFDWIIIIALVVVFGLIYLVSRFVNMSELVIAILIVITSGITLAGTYTLVNKLKSNYENPNSADFTIFSYDEMEEFADKYFEVVKKEKNLDNYSDISVMKNSFGKFIKSSDMYYIHYSVPDSSGAALNLLINSDAFKSDYDSSDFDEELKEFEKGDGIKIFRKSYDNEGNVEYHYCFTYENVAIRVISNDFILNEESCDVFRDMITKVNK